MLTGSQQVALNGSPLSHHRLSLALALKLSKDLKLKSERVSSYWKYWKWNEQEIRERHTERLRVTRKRLRVVWFLPLGILVRFTNVQKFGFNLRIPVVRLKPISKILINEWLDLERELVKLIEAWRVSNVLVYKKIIPIQPFVIKTGVLIKQSSWIL